MPYEYKVKDGRILKTNAKQRYTLGVVYEPMKLDTQGDFAEASEIEKACWNFMRKLQGKTTVTKIALQILDTIVKSLKNDNQIALDITDIWEDLEKSNGPLGYMHEEWEEDIGDIVENYIAPVDFEIDGQQIKKGTWLMGIVWSPEYFSKVENGEITGLSMGGRGKRIPVKEVKTDAQ